MPKISAQLQYYRDNTTKCNESDRALYKQYKNSTDPLEHAKYEARIKRATEWTKNWRKNNPEAHKKQARIQHLKDRFGITIEDYENLLKSQDNKCALCGGVFDPDYRPDTPHLDHCHKTGKIRGIIHQHCNHLLGCSRDEVSILEKAIVYLNKFNK